MKFKYHWYMAEDSGAGEGGEPFDPSVVLEQQQGKEEEPPARVQAKYESQLSKEYQNDDFTGIETLDALYKSNKELREKEKTALHLPTKDSTPEEIKGFFTKIGMPETKEGYELSDYDMDPASIKTMKEGLEEQAFRHGLTKAQANGIWKHELAVIKSIQKQGEDAVQKAQDNFRTNYDNLLKADFPDDAKRAERMTLEDNYYKEFTADTGLGEILKKTGLALNPEVRHALCKVWEKAAVKSNIGGARQGTPVPGTATEAMASIYKPMSI